MQELAPQRAKTPDGMQCGPGDRDGEAGPCWQSVATQQAQHTQQTQVPLRPPHLRSHVHWVPYEQCCSSPTPSPTDSSLRSSYDLSEAELSVAWDAQLQADLQLFWDRGGCTADAERQPQLPPPSRLGCLRSLAGTLYARGEVTAELGVLWQIVAMAEEVIPESRFSSSGRSAVRNAAEGGLAAAQRVDAGGYVVDTFERDSPNARTLVIVQRRIGSCLVSLGRQDEAVEELRACVSTAQALLSNAAADPDVLAAKVMLGSVLHRVGEYGKALRQLTQHLRPLMANPAHANSALARQGMLALGDCLARVKQHEEAVRTFQEVAEMFQAAGIAEGHGKALQQAMKSQEVLVDTSRRPRALSFAVSQLRRSASRSSRRASMALQASVESA